MLVVVLANKVKLSYVTLRSNTVAVLINLALITSLRTRRLNKLRNLLLVKALVVLLKLCVKIRVSSKRRSSISC
jgi:hypothetical protein